MGRKLFGKFAGFRDIVGMGILGELLLAADMVGEQSGNPSLRFFNLSSRM